VSWVWVFFWVGAAGGSTRVPVVCVLAWAVSNTASHVWQLVVPTCHTPVPACAPPSPPLCVRRDPAAAAHTRTHTNSICVLAGDIFPVDVITHIPIVCEDNKVPYVYVPSKEVSSAQGHGTLSSGGARLHTAPAAAGSPPPECQPPTSCAQPNPPAADGATTTPRAHRPPHTTHRLPRSWVPLA
jgi:hypothetical protein